jgi:hypothetical protein
MLTGYPAIECNGPVENTYIIVLMTIRQDGASIRIYELLIPGVRPESEKIWRYNRIFMFPGTIAFRQGSLLTAVFLNITKM